MPDTATAEIGALLAPMLKKTLFVALNIAVATSDEMLPYAADHLRYMNGLEERGLLFASGPYIQEDVVVGDGLTILRAATLEEAKALMDDEPLIKRGLRRFELHRWELREGRITINLNASRSAFDLA
jgi:uncharacterized protein